VPKFFAVIGLATGLGLLLATSSPAAMLGLTATDTVVGGTIQATAQLSESQSATGEISFEVFGPGDPDCSGVPSVLGPAQVNGNDSYPSGAFTPPGAGTYSWSAHYLGDSENLPADSSCAVSTVAKASPVVAGTATSAITVGATITDQATLAAGFSAGGQLVFRAYGPNDQNCATAPEYEKAVAVNGDGTYSPSGFVPPPGLHRWTVEYSGDANNETAGTACGAVNQVSGVTRAAPSIAARVKGRLPVGTPFQMEATLTGGHAPTGTIAFRIYGPGAPGCATPLSVDTIAVSGNGTYRSDPFVAQRPGRYRFVAAYSGNASNGAATQPCESTGLVSHVVRRTPAVKPRARLEGGRQMSLRAHLSGAASPSGVVSFRLYRPGDRTCRRKPILSGGISVKSNGTLLLAQYFATKTGVYRFSVGYSGDKRNRRYQSSCRGAQRIRVS